jgi:hypothetical protein
METYFKFDTDFGDTKSQWYRIGGRYLYPKIAWGMIGVFITVVGVLGLMMYFEYQKVVELTYHDILAEVRYQDIRHK